MREQYFESVEFSITTQTASIFGETELVYKCPKKVLGWDCVRPHLDSVCCTVMNGAVSVSFNPDWNEDFFYSDLEIR